MVLWLERESYPRGRVVESEFPDEVDWTPSREIEGTSDVDGWAVET